MKNSGLRASKNGWCGRRGKTTDEVCPDCRHQPGGGRETKVHAGGWNRVVDRGSGHGGCVQEEGLEVIQVISDKLSFLFSENDYWADVCRN
jgi:hypothetical protein